MQNGDDMEVEVVRLGKLGFRFVGDEVDGFVDEGGLEWLTIFELWDIVVNLL